jgi:hypothetical protein
MRSISSGSFADGPDGAVLGDAVALGVGDGDAALADGDGTAVALADAATA